MEARPLIGFYCSSKWAVEGLHESLAQEVKDFGIKVTLPEPGAYATEFGASGKRVPEMDVYADVRKQVFTRLSNKKTRQPSSDCRSRSQSRGRSGTPTTICARLGSLAYGTRHLC
ncbi:SDR family NAD(P)-dependent oxidoreductase [Paenibacillus riograndensis]|uniref:SDR family NAD(P)-dependent oxidoreductase n=1 Tax=Paenibacillus riograndensis TaxID=483937 RepID=UPI0038B372A3